MRPHDRRIYRARARLSTALVLIATIQGAVASPPDWIAEIQKAGEHSDEVLARIPADEITRNPGLAMAAIYLNPWAIRAVPVDLALDMPLIAATAVSLDREISAYLPLELRQNCLVIAAAQGIPFKTCEVEVQP